MIADAQLALGRMFQAVLIPLSGVSEWAPLIFFALLLAVLTSLIFRAASSPTRIRMHRDHALARLLEALLYRHDPLVALGAFGRQFAALLQYWGAILPALILALAVGLPLFVHAEAWLRWRPLLPGETAVISADWILPLPATPPLVARPVDPDDPRRVLPTAAFAAGATTHWRLQFPDAGGWLLHTDGGPSLAVQTSRRWVPLQPERAQTTLTAALLSTCMPPLTPGAPLRSIRVDYPERTYNCLALETGWILPFIFWTFLLAWLMKRPLGVEW